MSAILAKIGAKIGSWAAVVLAALTVIGGVFLYGRKKGADAERVNTDLAKADAARREAAQRAANAQADAEAAQARVDASEARKTVESDVAAMTPEQRDAALERWTRD